MKTISFEVAKEVVLKHLKECEQQINSFGSALPDYKNPEHRLVITDQQEYDFGWVFFYNSAKYVESKNVKDGLFGNAPLIVDKLNGLLYVTGTAKPTEYYLEQYRKGVRKLAKDG